MLRLLRISLSVLLLLNMATLAVVNSTSTADIYRLKIRLATTSDWTRLAIEGATVAPFVGQVIEGAGAPQLQVIASTDLSIVKQQFNETRVVADFQVYVADVEDTQLRFTVTKGHLGFTTVQIFNHNLEPPQIITEFTHQGIANNPENKRAFSIDISQVRARGAVELPPKPTVDKKLLAFYYPWYGTPTGPTGQWRHWDPKDPRYAATHKPLAGYYDSLDEATITRHIREAKEAGIDAFIASWWGISSFEDQVLQRILPIAKREGFAMTAYYEIADTRNQIVEDLRYILQRYGNSSAFLRVEGAPVIFVYVRVTEKFLADDWAFVFQQLEQLGLHCFCIGDNFYDYLYEQFQGVHTYIALLPAEELRRLYRVNALKARVRGKLFAATAVLGFDDSAISSHPRIQDRQNGEYYRQTWEAAVASNPDWVLVTSFNEWHEGTEIEPSVEFGRQYLELTQQQAMNWKGQ